MKRIAFLIASLFMIGNAHAVLEAGTQELGLSGSLNLDAVDDFALDLNFSYGKFFWDNIELGIDGNVNASDSTVGFRVGGFGEYNFNFGSNWVPYIGAGLGIGGASIDTDGSAGQAAIDDDVTALAITGNAGVKYFINENVAITGEFDYTFNTDDLPTGADEVTDAISRILIGTRFYF